MNTFQMLLFIIFEMFTIQRSAVDYLCISESSLSQMGDYDCSTYLLF